MKIQPFNQPPPALGNQYTQDRVLRSYLQRVLPSEMLESIESELEELGELSGDEWYKMQLADRLNDPVLTQWNPWGERIDHIEVSDVWKMAEKEAARRGIVATAYENKHGDLSRIHQFALAYLFAPSTDIYLCPLAMTDGAAHTLQQIGNQELIDIAVSHLTSRDPDSFWTSGQWMTESTGGSDVGQTETVAKQDEDGTWRLYGRKWFTSAVTAQMALTLARPVGNGPGGRGLAMFFVELRDEDGNLQNISVNRLKDKLGTRKVPTAELTLDGAPAKLVLGTDNGTRHIAPMLNITRVWNSVAAVSLMNRGLALARDFAKRRKAFGAMLNEKPLHVDTLASMQAEFEAAFHLTFRAVQLLGKKEQETITDAEHQLLRLLTPIVKLTTGKQAVQLASEVLEAFGGAGYVEDTGLPILLRDSQVLPIWEGTTNVLSLDTLRAMRETNGLEPIQVELQRCCDSLQDPTLVALAKTTVDSFSAANTWLMESMGQASELEGGARRFAMTLGRCLSLALLLEHAQWAIDQNDDRLPLYAAQRYEAAGINQIRNLSSDAAFALANA
ncbi:MAG: acyl-CoA dehydrogenase [Deltaproteobacteria bacterium]|nr:MAG: acyl-CoA dehydrogenase [Deltaproteobacteria bacterium]